MYRKLRIKIEIGVMTALFLLLAGMILATYGTSYRKISEKNEDKMSTYARMYFQTGSLPTEKTGADAQSGPPDALPGTASGSPPSTGGTNTASGSPLSTGGAGTSSGSPPSMGGTDTSSGSPPTGGGEGTEAGEDAVFPFEDGEDLMRTNFYAAAFGSDGTVLGIDNDGQTPFSSDSLTDFAKKLIAGGRTSGTSGDYLYKIAAENDVTLVVLYDDSAVRGSAVTLLRYTLVFGAIFLAVLGILTWLLAGRVIKPLEENDRKQRQFISDAGHELKTPVTVIEANAEMLERDQGSSKWLDNISYETKRMGTLVQQLLTLTRAENAPSAMTRCNLSHLVTGAALPFESMAFEKGLAIDCSTGEKIFIYGDENELMQLVSILLDNAIAHSSGRGGSVKVCVTSGRKEAVLSVSNTGPAIPEPEKERIFERFYRGGNEAGGQEKPAGQELVGGQEITHTGQKLVGGQELEGGQEITHTGQELVGVQEKPAGQELVGGQEMHCGLGLAIARAIAEKHKGKISVTSEGGINTFSVIFPLAKKTD